MAKSGKESDKVVMVNLKGLVRFLRERGKEFFASMVEKFDSDVMQHGQLILHLKRPFKKVGAPLREFKRYLNEFLAAQTSPA